MERLANQSHRRMRGDGAQSRPVRVMNRIQPFSGPPERKIRSGESLVLKKNFLLFLQGMNKRFP
jgi:hypothetical protein